MKLGDALLLFALWLWLTVAVGPWWLGVGLFLLAWALNLVGIYLSRRTMKETP